MCRLAVGCAQVCRVVCHLAESAVAHACRYGFVTTFGYTYFCRFEKVRMRAGAADIDHAPATRLILLILLDTAMSCCNYEVLREAVDQSMNIMQGCFLSSTIQAKG